MNEYIKSLKDQLKLNVSIDKSIDFNGTRNGSIRITKAEHVKSGYMSRRVGSMTDDCTNIHSEQDLLNAEKNINERVH